jgi:O-antigen/teichoic acid export membrane protein
MKKYGIYGEKKEIIYKSLLSLLFRALSYLIGFIFIYIIAHKFGVDTQGTFAIVFTILSMLTLISKLGIQTSMIKWMSVYFVNREYQEARSFFLKIYSLVSILSIVFAVLLYLNAGEIAKLFFKKENLIFPIQIISFCIPFFASTEIIAGYFQSKKRIAIYSFYNYTAKFFLPLIILLGTVLFGESLQSNTPILVYSVGITLNGVLAIGHLFRDLPKNDYSSKSMVTHKELLKTSLPILFSSSLVMLMWWSDTFILAVYKTEADVGVYSVAVKLATIISFVYSAVVSVLLPNIAQYYKANDLIKLQKTINYSSKIIFVATIPITIILIVFPQLILSIFGDEYQKGYLILLLLVIAQLTNSLTGPVGPFLSMSGNERKQLTFVFIALLLNFGVSILLVDRYGGEGVAFGSAIGMITWNVLGSLYIKSKFGIQTWIKIK